MKHDFGTSCTLHPNADFHFHEVLGGEASAEADKADQTALSVLMIFLLKEGTDASNTKELSVFTKHPGKGPSSILVRCLKYRVLTAVLHITQVPSRGGLLCPVHASGCHSNL